MRKLFKFLLIIIFILVMAIVTFIKDPLTAAVLFCTIFAGFVFNQIFNFIGSNKPFQDYFELNKKVSQVSPREFGIAEYNEYYLPRTEDEKIKHVLQPLNKTERVILITGIPGAGKTRTAYQIIKDKEEFMLIKFRDKTIQIDEIPENIFKGKIIVFFNDLNIFVKKIDSYNFGKLLNKLIEKSEESYIIGTCRTGDEYELIEDEFSSIIDFEVIELGSINESDGKEIARNLKIRFDKHNFNKTPGSVVLKLKEMHKRYRGLSPECHIIFRMAKLLYEARTTSPYIHTLKEVYLEEVRVQGWNSFSSTFENHLEKLINNSFFEIRKHREPSIKVTHAIYFNFENLPFSIKDFQWLQDLLLKINDAETLFNLGNSFYLKRNYKDSIKSYEGVVLINSNDSEAYNNLGNALSEVGRYVDAIESYNKAIEINPYYYKAYYNRGIALSEGGRYVDAIESFNNAIEINSNYFEAYYNLGISLFEVGKYEEAIKSFKRTVKINPNDSEAYNNLGIALSEVGRYVDAIESFNNAIEINPNDSEPYYNLGNALSEVGRYVDAIECYNKAIEINPNYLKAYYNLGIAFTEADTHLVNKSTMVKPLKYREKILDKKKPRNGL
jgi:tetratricopeptide (TPR) repeat protein